MTRQRIRRLLIVGLVGLIATFGYATGIEETDTEQESTIVGPLSRSQFDQRVQLHTWLTHLHEYDVAAASGQIIGTVEDSVVDISTGHIVYMAVRFDDGTDIAPGVYPLPPYVFERNAEEQTLRFVVEDLDFVANAPTFADLEQYTTTPGDTSEWEGRISGYWNTAPMPAAVQQAQADRRGFDYQYRYASGTVSYPGTIVRFSTMTEQSVNQASGAELGRVTDLVVSFRTGAVFFVELSLNQRSGGNSTYLIPLNALVLNRLSFEVTYPVDEYGFPGAYGYDGARPEIDSPEWFADARRFWNQMALGLGYPGGMKIVPRVITPAGLVLGYSVLSADSVGLGQIVDLLVTRDGDVPYAVIEFTSVFGVSEGRSLIPMNALSVNAGTTTATIDVIERELQGIPMFGSNELPDTSRRGWDEEFREYWAYLHTDLQKIYSEDVVTVRSIEAVEQPAAMPVSAFTNFDVVTETGADVGTVEDIALDLVRGEAAYAMLGVGGFLDIGDKNVAVPMGSFAWDPDNARLVLGVSVETIENAPGFDDDEWPMTGNPNLEAEMTDYWSQEL